MSETLATYAILFREKATAMRACLEYAQSDFENLAYLVDGSRTRDDLRTFLNAEILRQLCGRASSYREVLDLLVPGCPFTRADAARLCGYNVASDLAVLTAQLIWGPLRQQLPDAFDAMRLAVGAAPDDSAGMRRFWDEVVIPCLAASAMPAATSVAADAGDVDDGWTRACKQVMTCEGLVMLLDGHDGRSTAGAASAAPVGARDAVGASTGNCSFHQCGTGWEIRFGLEHGVFPAWRGFQILARLLRSEHGRAVEATELQGMSPGGQHTHQEQADPAALASAEAWLKNDLPVLRSAVQSPAEIDDLDEKETNCRKYVEKSEGLDGRPRPLGPKSPTESARTSVRANLTRAYEIMNPSMPRLVEHFKLFVLTEGNAYAYRPGNRVDWDL